MRDKADVQAGKLNDNADSLPLHSIKQPLYDKMDLNIVIMMRA